MQAVHQTAYSNGIVALDEQFLETGLASDAEGDDRLMRRFTLRKRRAAEADFLIFANNHWNFNVRGFNPGGNHGGLLRMSTHSVLMLAGGAASGIPRNHIVEEPYDSLSFAPTILELMGKSEDARKLPGRPIVELLSKPASTGSTR
jgi:hypothetical protein